MNQKGFAPIVLLIAVGILLIGGIAYYATRTPAPFPSPIPTPTSTTAPSTVNNGVMPTMSYKIASQKLDQYGNPTDIKIDIYANGNKVTTFDNTNILLMGDVVFFAGNSKKVYFTIQRSGLGDYTSPNNVAYELNLQTGAVKLLVGNRDKPGNWNSAQDFDMTPDFAYLNYASRKITSNKEFTSSSSSWAIHILNLNTDFDQSIPFTPSSLAGINFYIQNVRMSPDQKRIAVGVERVDKGPDGSWWQVWIINLQNQQAILYEKGGTPEFINLTDWKDNLTPQWRQ